MSEFIRIDSDQGRIGNLWWVNSDQSTLRRMPFDVAGFRVHLDCFHWGTFGFGKKIRIAFE